jgi:hypothetical protein
MKHIKMFEAFINESISFIEDSKGGEKITNHKKYTLKELTKAKEDLIKLDPDMQVDFIEDTLHASIEDQEYYYGWSDAENCWTGSYHVNDEMQVSLPMNLPEFLDAVKDALAYLGK